jgi:hypothetical protein
MIIPQSTTDSRADNHEYARWQFVVGAMALPCPQATNVSKYAAISRQMEMLKSPKKPSKFGLLFNRTLLWLDRSPDFEGFIKCLIINDLMSLSACFHDYPFAVSILLACH